MSATSDKAMSCVTLSNDAGAASIKWRTLGMKSGKFTLTSYYLVQLMFLAMFFLVMIPMPSAHASIGKIIISLSIMWPVVPTSVTHSSPYALVPFTSSSSSTSSSLMDTCEFDDVRRRRDNIIRIGVILPMHDTDFAFGLMYSQPAFEIAREEVYRTENLLAQYTIEFDFRDSNCSDVYGPLEGIEMYANREVDLFIGPCCDYAVAPLARFASYWKIPILTAGGLVQQLNDKGMYTLLTRMVGTYSQLADYMVDILRHFRWYNVGMILHQWKNPKKFNSNQWFTLEATFLLIQRVWNSRISMEYAKTFDMYDYTGMELESHLIALSRLCRGESLQHGVARYSSSV